MRLEYTKNSQNIAQTSRYSISLALLYRILVNIMRVIICCLFINAVLPVFYRCIFDTQTVISQTSEQHPAKTYIRSLTLVWTYKILSDISPVPCLNFKGVKSAKFGLNFQHLILSGFEIVYHIENLKHSPEAPWLIFLLTETFHPSLSIIFTVGSKGAKFGLKLAFGVLGFRNEI